MCVCVCVCFLFTFFELMFYYIIGIFSVRRKYLFLRRKGGEFCEESKILRKFFSKSINS